MIKVNDIQDALLVEDLIQGVIRRADGCSKEHVLIELDMICTTLQKNCNSHRKRNGKGSCIMYTYTTDLFSDLHKDVYGYRPRGEAMDEWNSRTPRQKNELYNALCDELEEITQDDARRDARNVMEFTGEILNLIELGAKDRETALRWMTQEDKFYSEQCVSHWVWSRGILFTDYGKQLVKDLMNIVEIKAN